MADEMYECGHPKSVHFEMKWVKPKKEGGRTYRQWVAKGEGMCFKCSCEGFKGKV